jgi:hypothetical protein
MSKKEDNELNVSFDIKKNIIQGFVCAYEEHKYNTIHKGGKLKSSMEFMGDYLKEMELESKSQSDVFLNSRIVPKTGFVE